MTLRTWEYRIVDGYAEDEWDSVWAYDAMDAAEKVAEQYDCEDYPLLRGETLTVVVRDLESLVETRWEVCGEYVPVYYVSAVED